MRPKEIRRKLRALRRKQGAVLLAGLGDQIRRHAETGELPADSMARTFIEMGQAAQAAMDASVGGGPEHDQACQNFAAKYAAWGQAVRECGL